MAREEDLWHCLHIQLIDTLSRTGGIPFTGFLPKDRAQILHELEVAKQNISEKQLKEYRNSIVSL